MEQERARSAALELFLVFGPLLGYAALEPALLRPDWRRPEEGRPLVPARLRAGARDEAPQCSGR